MSDLIIFLIKTLGLGLLTGYVLGYLFKKTLKIMVFIIALIIVLVVVLGHNEIMEIEWLAAKTIYQNSIEPGLQQYSERLNVFFRNMPFTIGFIVGSLYGLKRG